MFASLAVDRRGAGALLPRQTPLSSAVRRGVSSPGHPLDPDSRAWAESRFGRATGHRLDAVRVHTDREAARSAEELGALAYTVGDHIVFGEGRHRPGTRTGARLLAHELVHVLQQNGRAEGTGVTPALSTPDQEHEREAAALGRAAALGGRPGSPSRIAPLGIHRQQATDEDEEVSSRPMPPVASAAGGTGSSPQPVPSVTWGPQLLAVTLWSDDANPKGCYGESRPAVTRLFSACGTERKFCTSDYLFKVWFHLDADIAPRPAPFTPPRVAIDLSFTDAKGARVFSAKDADSAPRYAGPGRPLSTKFGQAFTVHTTNPGTFSADLSMVDPDTGVVLTYSDKVACDIDPCV